MNWLIGLALWLILGQLAKQILFIQFKKKHPDLWIVHQECLKKYSEKDVLFMLTNGNRTMFLTLSIIRLFVWPVHLLNFQQFMSELKAIQQIKQEINRLKNSTE